MYLKIFAVVKVSKKQKQSNHNSQSEQKKMSPGANEISKGNDTKAPEARENAGDQDAIGLRLKSDWWGKKKRVFLSVVNIHMGDCLEQKHITTEFLQMKFGECFSPD